MAASRRGSRVTLTELRRPGCSIEATAASADTFEILRQRLVSRKACDGSVEDLGRFRTVWFEDPAGMQVESTLIIDPTLRDVHAP